MDNKNANNDFNRVDYREPERLRLDKPINEYDIQVIANNLDRIEYHRNMDGVAKLVISLGSLGIFFGAYLISEHPAVATTIGLILGSFGIIKLFTRRSK